jgi:hypothetical protein
VDEAERTRYSDAFAACGGLQCGFCIPGIVMRAKSQVDKKGADLKREDMARHLGAQLCRCTGYVKVLDAIEAVAKGTAVDVSMPGGVGSRGTKYEANELALGDRGYVDDIRVPGMLHAALHLTKHVRADITAIDTTAAKAAPAGTFDSMSIALPQTSARMRAAIGPPTDSGIVSATSMMPFLATPVSMYSGKLVASTQPVLGGDTPAQGTRSEEARLKTKLCSASGFSSSNAMRSRTA